MKIRNIEKLFIGQLRHIVKSEGLEYSNIPDSKIADMFDDIPLFLMAGLDIAEALARVAKEFRVYCKDLKAHI